MFHIKRTFRVAHLFNRASRDNSQHTRTPVPFVKLLQRLRIYYSVIPEEAKKHRRGSESARRPRSLAQLLITRLVNDVSSERGEGNARGGSGKEERGGNPVTTFCF